MGTRTAGTPVGTASPAAVRVVAGPVVADGTLARLVELEDGSGRVESWNARERVWVEGGADAFEVLTGIGPGEGTLRALGLTREEAERISPNGNSPR